jgi:hypothetical protein
MCAQRRLASAPAALRAVKVASTDVNTTFMFREDSGWRLAGAWVGCAVAPVRVDSNASDISFSALITEGIAKGLKKS